MTVISQSIDQSLRQAFQFFLALLAHGSARVGSNATDALALARAERDAQAVGVYFLWRPDERADLSWLDGKDDNGRFLFPKSYREQHHDVDSCRAILPCAEWEIPEIASNCHHADELASLYGITDADNTYRRVIEAELALEAAEAIQAASCRSNDTVAHRSARQA